MAPLSTDSIVERFGHLPVIREALLARDDLAVATRQTLVAKLSQTLAGFVVARQVHRILALGRYYEHRSDH